MIKSYLILALLIHFPKQHASKILKLQISKILSDDALVPGVFFSHPYSGVSSKTERSVRDEFNEIFCMKNSSSNGFQTAQ